MGAVQKQLVIGGCVITKQAATVYYAPTARRRYFTKKSALLAEARARIEKKHPSERSEHDDSIGYFCHGWHWTSMPRSEVLLRRYVRLLKSNWLDEAK